MKTLEAYIKESKFDEGLKDFFTNLGSGKTHLSSIIKTYNEWLKRSGVSKKFDYSTPLKGSAYAGTGYKILFNGNSTGIECDSQSLKASEVKQLKSEIEDYLDRKGINWEKHQL